MSFWICSSLVRLAQPTTTPSNKVSNTNDAVRFCITVLYESYSKPKLSLGVCSTNFLKGFAAASYKTSVPSAKKTRTMREHLGSSTISGPTANLICGFGCFEVKVSANRRSYNWQN
jgi:hypothetical protein